MRYLNLGCGTRFHADWENVDIAPSHPAVRRHDLRKPLPYADNTFAVVYHSHVLEHFTGTEAPHLLAECHRVLLPGGIVRVAVPDLEQIARCYLDALERVRRSERGAEHDYDWMMLELYDQMVREESGGQMLEYLHRKLIPNEAFVVNRLGGEARRILTDVRQQRTGSSSMEGRRGGLQLSELPQRMRSKFLELILGEVGCHALSIGLFRLGGEIHRWMYDQHSLARLLQQADFQMPLPRTALESSISGWANFHLDSEPDGSIYKPDSLYMEAAKPDP